MYLLLQKSRKMNKGHRTPVFSGFSRSWIGKSGTFTIFGHELKNTPSLSSCIFVSE